MYYKTKKEKSGCNCLRDSRVPSAPPVQKHVEAIRAASIRTRAVVTKKVANGLAQFMDKL